MERMVEAFTMKNNDRETRKQFNIIYKFNKTFYGQKIKNWYNKNKK